MSRTIALRVRYFIVLLTLCYNIVDDSHTKSELNETPEMINLKIE